MIVKFRNLNNKGKHMKKMIKMSLVAAVAVAGFSSTASAKPLTESIKDVDLSGYLRYRYTNGDQGAETNEYKTVIKLKSKVNDNVSAFVKVAGAASTTDASGDADPDETATKEAKFIINAGGATIIAGKQALATPFADGADQQGTGIVALYPVNKSLTVAGGWYTNSDAQVTTTGVKGGRTDIIGGNNIAALAVIAKAGVANVEAWYAQVSENNPSTTTEAGATAINLNVKAKAGIANIEVNYATVDYTGATGDTLADPEQTRVVVSAAPVAGVTVAAGAVKVGTDGGDVTLGDSDAKANFVMEAFDAAILKDTTAYYLAASYKTGAICAGVEYGTASEATGAGTADASELKVKAAYAMSKNFKVSAFITKDSDALDGQDKNRIEIKYTF